MHTVKWFQVLLCVTYSSIKYQSFVYSELNDQTVLFQTIQFSISHLSAYSLNVKQFYLTHRWIPIRYYGPGSNSNEGVQRIPQSSSITEASLSGCLMLYPRHSLGGGVPFLSAEMQLVYSTAAADWAPKGFWSSYNFLFRSIYVSEIQLPENLTKSSTRVLSHDNSIDKSHPCSDGERKSVSLCLTLSHDFQCQSKFLLFSRLYSGANAKDL